MRGISIVLLTCFTLVIGEDFPIGVWSSDGWNSCADPDMLPVVAGMGANILFHELDNSEDISEALDVLAQAGEYGMKIIVKPNWSRFNWVRGQFALYPATSSHFNHETWIGQETMSEDVWVAVAGVDPPGWLQRDLVTNYQQGDESWTALSEYTARFVLSSAGNDLPAPAVTLYAVSIDTIALQETILDSMIVYGTDFTAANQNQQFDLSFSCTGLPADNLMDYRIYWHGSVSINNVSTAIMDERGQSMYLDHAYDDEMHAELQLLRTAPGAENLLFWDLIDEPAADQLGCTSHVRQLLSQYDEPAFINLFPGYARQHQHESVDYSSYISAFIETGQPAVISFDHYPFGWTTEEPDFSHFITDLAMYREFSQSTGLPFWYTGQAFDFHPQGQIDETKMNLCMFSALAYGVQGVMWWRLKDGLTHHCFQPTEFYTMAQSVNTRIQAIGNELMSLNSVSAFALPYLDIPAESFVRDVSMDSLVIGTFTHVENSAQWMMLVNLRFHESDTVVVTVFVDQQPEMRLVEDILALAEPSEYQLHFQQWMLEPDADEIPIVLAPGEGRLFAVWSDLLPGDINRDYAVDIADIVWMVNLIMVNDQASEYESWSGDMNSDNMIDILDIVLLVTWIMEQ